MREIVQRDVLPPRLARAARRDGLDPSRRIAQRLGGAALTTLSQPPVRAGADASPTSTAPIDEVVP